MIGDFYTFVNSGANCSSVGSAQQYHGSLRRGAELLCRWCNVGGALSRYQMLIRCAGSGGRVDTNGVNLLNGTQHADTTVFMDHAVQGCPSRENFRAVIDDRGRSVFQGRILVRREAQQTDAKMMTRALLLSDEAEVDNKPDLEIFAEYLSCGHGSAAGRPGWRLLLVGIGRSRRTPPHPR